VAELWCLELALYKFAVIYTCFLVIFLEFVVMLRHWLVLCANRRVWNWSVGDNSGGIGSPISYMWYTHWEPNTAFSTAELSILLLLLLLLLLWLLLLLLVLVLVSCLINPTLKFNAVKGAWKHIRFLKVLVNS